MPITEHFAPGVHQVSPARDPLAIILSAYEQTREMPGSLLVLVPTEGWAQRLRGRLEQRGLPVACGDDQWDRMRATWPVIIGTRGDALAPTSRLAGVVIVDADDDAFTSESSPTWNALVMAHERVTRDGGLLWATSVLPSPQLLALGDLHTSDHTPWPHIEVVDRRNRDPHEGVLAGPALRQAHRALSQGDGVAVAVILQRLGTGRLLSCRSCGELARCAVCHQPEQEVDGMLSCAERHNIRENFCQLCGATNLRKVQTGVTTLARDISLQLSQPVTEVTASTATDPTTRVVVGTEAVFSRLRRCPVVIFVDFDQYILAPRASAHRQAVSAVTRAARLVVASGDAAGTVIVQTRRSDALITALMSGEVSAIRDEDVVTAEVLGLPPYGASAEISGDGAEGFVASVPMAGLRRSESMGTVTLHAASVDALCNALAQATRTGDRLRLAVS